MKRRMLADLFAVDRPGAVLEEVCAFLQQNSTSFDPETLRRIYRATLSLYQGKWPGYRACNTDYHDFAHVAEVFLAMARLIHGALLQNRQFSKQQIHAALAAAILHDSGYIQEIDDPEDSGAVHRDVHETRSISFIGRHGHALGLFGAEIDAGQSLIECTVMRTETSSIAFPSDGIELLGKMLAVSDLVAQLSEQTYLEKLSLLHAEDSASACPRYGGEVDVIRKAIAFYRLADRRIENSLGNWHAYMEAHFSERWGRPENLYREAIARQKQRLEAILSKPEKDPRPDLRRTDTLRKTRNMYMLSNDADFVQP